MKTSDTDVFFELLRAGLWENEALLLQFREVDYNELMRVAEEQSVMGLVTAGMEHVKDLKVPQDMSLQFIGQTLQIEQQNRGMNLFIANLIEKLRNKDIYALLLKGQGVAQCYQRPLWRFSGDVDLFLSDENYTNAKKLLIPLASEVETEYEGFKHLGLTIDGWVVELHGSLRVGLPNRINRELDDIQRDTFFNGNVRSWNNGATQVFMLGKENDIVYVFVHFLNHFYKGGVGLRQICDWCRLLWSFRNEVDLKNIESRIRKMGLVSEWNAFGTFAVDYLGMQKEAMPLYNENDNPNQNLHRKAELIKDFILEVGNMGHNRDMSYFE